MQFVTIFRILGILLMIFSLSMLPPAVFARHYQEIGAPAFIAGFLLTILTGFILWLLCRSGHHDLKTRDGFLIVALFWITLSIFGAFPLMLAYEPHLSFTDAMFEAASGLTTTGTTVLTQIDDLPHAIRFYRQELQFLGGMGIIVLAIAILPMLGIGGMQLYRAETPGPIKDTKLTPRITETAKSLWYIYIGLVISCALAYWLCGMTPFDAVGESFSTIATGGFSTHSASFGFYHSGLIDMIAVTFMLLSATNFSLHFLALQRRSLKFYWQDPEFRSYILITFFAVITVTITLLMFQIYKSPDDAIINGIFNTVSMLTTTGLVTSDFNLWPSFVPVLLILLGMMGACAASTCGGIKIIRLLILGKQGNREIKRLIHPKAVLPLKFGRHTLSEHVIQAIWGFIAVYIALFVLLLLAVMATGLDIRTAFGAVGSCISNSGAGIGDVSSTFAHISNTAKWLLTIAMFAGRLEIFTLLVLFTPTFWRG